MLPDFSNLLGILMQLFFWFTPIIWNLSMLGNHQTLLKIMQCTPFTYLVTGMRQVFIPENIITADNGIYTITLNDTLLVPSNIYDSYTYEMVLSDSKLLKPLIKDKEYYLKVFYRG